MINKKIKKEWSLKGTFSKNETKVYHCIQYTVIHKCIISQFFFYFFLFFLYKIIDISI